MTNKQIMTLLLNINCAETDKPIEPKEVVRLFDWGRERRLMGYGAYEWDSHDRSFILVPQKEMNEFYGFNDFYGIEDRYDLFRTSPEKLNADEIKSLATL